MDIMDKLHAIFRDVFDDDSLVLTAETTPADIEDWDSLAQINLLAACEREFGLTFDIDEILRLENVGDMAELIRQKL